MSRKSRKNVGVIGLGIIGSRVAAALRTAGYQVYVWNRSAKPAPNFLGSPAEIAESADIIQLFVADATALFEVIEAMGEALTARHIIICSGTVGPEAVLEAAQVVESKGAQFLDAPFTGSKLAAEKRQLIYYIGGAEHTFLKAKPILEATSKAIVRIGEVGHASSVKVVTNMISAVTTQVLAEALSIVQKAGLQPEVLAAAIEHNACRSGVIDLKLPKMVAGDYEAHFSLKNMFKDVQLGIHMANALDIEIPATTVTAGVMYGALNQNWGDFDFSVLFKNYTPSPSDGLEDLPALENAPSQPELTEPGTTSTTARTETPAARSPSEEVALIPLTDAISVTVEPVSSGINGAGTREMVPAEEAARIIEAVVAHVTSQRQELGALLNEHRNHASRTEQPRVAELEVVVTPLTKTETATEKPIAAAATAEPVAKEKVDEPKPAEPAQPDMKDDKAGGKPINFVRRWFVGRSQN